uniref:Portal protein n=1 Tax=viral metagenome TaxID=1070528 RepID=A0A6M3IHJ5_9ZZZZ
MSYQFVLPKDKVQAANTVHSLVTQGRGKRNPVSIRWWIASAYLQGYRDFSRLDYTGGTVSLTYMDESGLLKFKFEEIVSKYVTQLGRLLALDLSPTVERMGISLDGMRKASVAQVVLDSAFPQDKVKKLALLLHPIILMYGTAGLALWVDSPDSMGIEVIPPWEILPIPIDVSGPHDVRGIIRARYVPVDWIKGLMITPGEKSKEYKNIDHVSMPTGNMPIDADAIGEGLMSMTSGGGGFFVKATTDDERTMAGRAGKKKDETHQDLTQLIEIWTETSDGYLAEYAVYAGMTKYVELYRHNHSESKYHMPIRIARDVITSGFWGRSYVDQLISLNREVEIAMSSMFQAVSDFDIYGFQLWPTSLGVPPEAERGQDGLKRIRYEPDYTVPDTKPENIFPTKMTAPHVDIVRVGLEMMDRIANQPTEMMSGSAPGRVDSSKGLGFLYEMSTIPLSSTAKNIADAVSGVYRAMLGIIRDQWTDRKVVSLTNLDDSLAGVILDAEAGTMSLSHNSIPHPDEVSLTIASEVPVSKEQQKYELKEALREGRITLEEFSFNVRKQGLDLPVGMEIEWQNYRRAMLNNILLFGDGETPGQAIGSPSDLHRVHLKVLDCFMARPEFYAASAGVREAFIKERGERLALLGNYLDQLEYPEDIAKMESEQYGSAEGVSDIF